MLRVGLPGRKPIATARTAPAVQRLARILDHANVVKLMLYQPTTDRSAPVRDRRQGWGGCGACDRPPRPEARGPALDPCVQGAALDGGREHRGCPGPRPHGCVRHRSYRKPRGAMTRPCRRGPGRTVGRGHAPHHACLASRPANHHRAGIWYRRIAREFGLIGSSHTPSGVQDAAGGRRVKEKTDCR